MTRVVVFIDGQNFRKALKSLFYETPEGRFRPDERLMWHAKGLGVKLAQPLGAARRWMEGVGAYLFTILPSSEHKKQYLWADLRAHVDPAFHFGPSRPRRFLIPSKLPPYARGLLEEMT